MGSNDDIMLIPSFNFYLPRLHHSLWLTSLPAGTTVSVDLKLKGLSKGTWSFDSNQYFFLHYSELDYSGLWLTWLCWGLALAADNIHWTWKSTEVITAVHCDKEATLWFSPQGTEARVNYFWPPSYLGGWPPSWFGLTLILSVLLALCSTADQDMYRRS